MTALFLFLSLFLSCFLLPSRSNVLSLFLFLPLWLSFSCSCPYLSPCPRSTLFHSLSFSLSLLVSCSSPIPSYYSSSTPSLLLCRVLPLCVSVCLSISSSLSHTHKYTHMNTNSVCLSVYVCVFCTHLCLSVSVHLCIPATSVTVSASVSVSTSVSVYVSHRLCTSSFSRDCARLLRRRVEETLDL